MNWNQWLLERKVILKLHVCIEQCVIWCQWVKRADFRTDMQERRSDVDEDKWHDIWRRLAGLLVKKHIIQLQHLSLIPGPVSPNLQHAIISIVFILTHLTKQKKHYTCHPWMGIREDRRTRKFICNLSDNVWNGTAAPFAKRFIETLTWLVSPLSHVVPPLCIYWLSNEGETDPPKITLLYININL